MNKTKKQLAFSAISLLLCFAMLLGSTFAWFTDSATSSGNIIQTGNLDVQMHWADEYLSADSDQWNNADGVPVFTYDNWEPGYTDIKYVKITNNGNLNLKWKLSIDAESEVSKLSDVIDVYFVNPVGENITTLNGLTSAGVLTDVLANNVNSTGALTEGQSAILAIAFHMHEDAGNDYQDLSLCEEGFSLKLIAAQEVGEEDSFGDNYDIGAEWGENTVSFAASTAVNSSNVIYGALANDLVIGGEGINATVPANVKLADGATSLDLSVKAVETDANITVGEGLAAKSLDVHIDGVSADNTTPIIVNLGSIFKPGLDETEVKLYHIENGVPVVMTRVNSVHDFARHNQFTYNAETGEVSIYVASFSVFSVVQTAASKWEGTYDWSWYNADVTSLTISSAAQFAAFRTIVDGGYYDAEWTWHKVTQDSFAGKTVTLAVDIDLANILFDPIGKGYTYDKASNTAFMGTFDGGNHTIYNLYQNGWDLDPDKKNYSTYTYSTAGGGLFASIEDATIKNLVVSGANIVFECVDIGIVVGYAQHSCVIENIVVTNSTIANYNRATGGVVGEVCYGGFGTDASAGKFSHVFNNIVVDSSVVVSSLWGSFDTLCGGVIGGKWGNATVKMTNVISACELDVYSDVTAAYQWYAYRRCGMLIGHTEQNSPKQALNAAAGFLTCENVKVYYGDWVNYKYFEFENQDSDTGKRYPWVRAQASPVGNNGAFSNPRYGVPKHDGTPVTNYTIEELIALNGGDIVTDYTPIVFDQLYGGGQGVYGCSEHDGVTVIRSNHVKTVYIVIPEDQFDNLKLKYYFKNGNDIWSTSVEGMDMSSMLVSHDRACVYKLTLPEETNEIELYSGDTFVKKVSFNAFEEGAIYDLDGSKHTHVYTNGVCVCGTACTHSGGTATCMSAAICEYCDLTYGDTNSGNHVSDVNSLSWTTDASSHKKICSCGVALTSGAHSYSNGVCTACGYEDPTHLNTSFIKTEAERASITATEKTENGFKYMHLSGISAYHPTITLKNQAVGTNKTLNRYMLVRYRGSGTGYGNNYDFYLTVNGTKLTGGQANKANWFNLNLNNDWHYIIVDLGTANVTSLTWTLFDGTPTAAKGNWLDIEYVKFFGSYAEAKAYEMATHPEGNTYPGIAENGSNGAITAVSVPTSQVYYAHTETNDLKGGEVLTANDKNVTLRNDYVAQGYGNIYVTVAITGNFDPSTLALQIGAGPITKGVVVPSGTSGIWWVICNADGQLKPGETKTLKIMIDNPAPTIGAESVLILDTLTITRSN